MNKELLAHSVRVAKRYMFYQASQHWGRRRIEQYQDACLKRIVLHAARHVPYYRNLFREIGFDPKKFSGRSDLHHIPLLDKETLRQRQHEFIADNADVFGVKWDSTSGSTGTPLHFIIDHSTRANKLACVLRSYQWGGYLPGRKTFSLQSYRFNDPNDLYKHFPYANLWRFDAKKLKRETALQIITMIGRFKPAMLIGYPFSLYMLAKFGREARQPVGKLRSIITAGETLSPRRRQLLEDTYQCKVVDFYSHHEDVAVITECSFQQKHICEDFAYNEIVDDHGRNSWVDGSGELVGTGFYNFAMPLIRYKIADRVEADPERNHCPCGRHFRNIDRIVGRQNDYVETPDGRRLGNVLEHSVDHARGVILSQCVQDALDHIYINVVVDETYNQESAKALVRGFRERLGDEIHFDIKLVHQLERNKSGKTPFIFSKIGHQYL